jgi:hypothetical protein
LAQPPVMRSLIGSALPSRVTQTSQTFGTNFTNHFRRCALRSKERGATRPHWSSRNALQAIKTRAEDYITGFGLLSSGACAKFIEGIRNRDPLAAAYALAYLVHWPFQNINHRQALDGVFEAMLFDRGLLDTGVAQRVTAHARALEDLQVSWRNQLEANGSK